MQVGLVPAWAAPHPIARKGPGFSAVLRTKLKDLGGFLRAVQDPARHFQVPAPKDALYRVPAIPLKETLPRDLEILVWNLQKGASERTLEVLKSEGELRDVDLHLFQEYRGETAWSDALRAELSGDWWIAPHFRDAEGNPTGVATGSRAASTRAFAKQSEGREPISATPKMILYSSYPVEGSSRELGVINVHAINFVTFDLFESQLRDLLVAAQAHEGPLVVAGDFNTWSATRLDRLRETLVTAGMRQAELDPRDEKPGLDHVFTRGLEVREARVLKEYDSSDHFPIRARLTISE